MRFLFLTDYHGNHSAYKDAFKLAEQEGYHIVIGGDCLPKSMKHGQPFAKTQAEFLKGWLIPKIEKLRQKGLNTWMMFGNDDSMGIVHMLDNAEKRGTLTRLDGFNWHPFGDYYILGVPYVPDYPFRLKDWCVGDVTRTATPEGQFGSPLYTDQYHYVEAPRAWNDEIADRPCLKEILEVLDDPPEGDASKCVFVMHSPPAWGGLDTCADGRRVGSVAGLNHIAARQYLMSLHGHIHESPAVTGQWHSRILNTLAVQPGACPPRPVMVDLDAGTVSHDKWGSVSIRVSPSEGEGPS
jgi:Icc-related predicted phosphoesterase